MLSLVFEATFAGEPGKGYQAAWWYARALEEAFTKKIKPEKLPAYIEARGSLKKMYAAAVENNPRRRAGRDLDKYFDLDRPLRKRRRSQDPGNSSRRDGATPTLDGDKPAIELSEKLTRKLRKYPSGSAKKIEPCGRRTIPAAQIGGGAVGALQKVMSIPSGSRKAARRRQVSKAVRESVRETRPPTWAEQEIGSAAVGGGARHHMLEEIEDDPITPGPSGTTEVMKPRGVT